MGRKIYIIFAMVFTIITFIGITLVLTNTNNLNAGAAIIPALFAFIFIRLYQKSKNQYK